MTDKFRETLNLLQDNQEEMRLLKTRVRYVYFPAGIYLHMVNNRNTRTRCEICSKLVKTPE